MNTQTVGPWRERTQDLGYLPAARQPGRTAGAGDARTVQPLPDRRPTGGANSPAEVLARMRDDYERAVYCRTRAEEYRRRWFAGREREIAYVRERAESGDRRFTRLTPGQIGLVGRLRWSESGLAQMLARREERYTRWMQFYLAFAEYQLPVKHVRLDRVS